MRVLSLSLHQSEHENISMVSQLASLYRLIKHSLLKKDFRDNERFITPSQFNLNLEHVKQSELQN